MKDLPSPADDVSFGSVFCPERRLSGRGNDRGSNYVTSFKKMSIFQTRNEKTRLNFEETVLKELYHFSRFLYLSLRGDMATLVLVILKPMIRDFIAVLTSKILEKNLYTLILEFKVYPKQSGPRIHVSIPNI